MPSSHFEQQQLYTANKALWLSTVIVACKIQGLCRRVQLPVGCQPHHLQLWSLVPLVPGTEIAMRCPTPLLPSRQRQRYSKPSGRDYDLSLKWFPLGSSWRCWTSSFIYACSPLCFCFEDKPAACKQQVGDNAHTAKVSSWSTKVFQQRPQAASCSLPPHVTFSTLKLVDADLGALHRWIPEPNRRSPNVEVQESQMFSREQFRRSIPKTGCFVAKLHRTQMFAT